MSIELTKGSFLTCNIYITKVSIISIQTNNVLKPQQLNAQSANQCVPT
uniref:Uncharacterized protein n=1 Tax=Rhizophora mucronata TaxID=61149 RepID=A0A2P2NB72_RHIMU